MSNQVYIAETVGTLVVNANVVGKYVQGSLGLTYGPHNITISQDGLPFQMAKVFWSYEQDGEQVCGGSEAGWADAAVDENNVITITANVTSNTATLEYLGIGN